MNKISRIVPSSARTAKSDVSESHPVRPGVPTFGRPEGRNSVQDRVSLNSATPGQGQMIEDNRPLTYRNPKEQRHAKIADELTKKFFQTQRALQPVQTPEPELAVEPVEDFYYEPLLLIAEETPNVTEQVTRSTQSADN